MSQLKEVTKTNPCPHCGKPDWCYSLDELTVCNRDFPPADGYYQTSKVDKDGHYFYASIESRERFQLDLKSKKIRPQQTRIWYYPDRNGNRSVRVIRIDDGLGGKPRRWQESWDGTQWVKGLNAIKREDIPIYRYQEVQSAILQGKDIYLVEGEVCADALWALGIPATTNIGGSGKWRDSDTQDLLLKDKGQRTKDKGIKLGTNEEKADSKGENPLNSALLGDLKGIELETSYQKADNEGESSFNSGWEGERIKGEKAKNISDLSEELDPWLDNDEIKSQDGHLNSVNSVNSSTSEEDKLISQNSLSSQHPNTVTPQYPSLLLNNTKFILCPDRDVPGIQHMKMISQSLPNTQWLYAFPQSPLWDVNLPESGGLDVADWINELRSIYRLTDEKIKATILNSVEDVRPTLLSSLGNLEVKRQLVNNSSLSAQTNNSPLINSQQPLSTTCQPTANNHLRTMNDELRTTKYEVGTQNSQLQERNGTVSTSQGRNGQDAYGTNSTPESPKVIPFLDENALVGKLQELINIAPKKSVLTTIFNQLGKLIGLTTSEIRKLYHELTKENDLEIDLPIRQEEINQLLALESENFDLQDYLPVEMVQPLQGMAEILGSNSVSQLTALLPVVASLVNPQTKLTLINKSKFTARPIFYSAIVGESGSAKSPTLNIFTEPLVKYMQKKVERVYQESLTLYETVLADKNIKEKPPKPKPLEYYVSDFTSEAIAEIIHNQPNKGFLMFLDELSGLIKQNNAYRGGKGADQEKILSGRDGNGWKVNRKNGDRFQNESSSYSIVGGITSDILRQQMGTCQDESGYWARFCYSYLPLKECKFPDDEANIDIYPLLCSLYENLESLPAYHYHLCSEGRGLYREFFYEMEKKKMSEPNQAMRAIYSKSKRIAGEIALLLQSLHQAFYLQPDVQEMNLNVTLEPKFMAMGIKLAHRYIGEIKAIYLKNEGNEENNLSSVYARIIAMSQRKGWLKARDLKQGDRHFRNLSSVDIRRHFQELVDLGFGEIKGIGKSLEWLFSQRRKDKGQKELTIPLNTVDNVDKRFLELTQEVNNWKTQTSSEIELNLVEQIDVVDNQKQEFIQRQTPFNPSLQENLSSNFLNQQSNVPPLCDCNDISQEPINSELMGDNDLTFASLWGNTEENIELSNPNDFLDYQLNDGVEEIEIQLDDCTSIELNNINTDNYSKERKNLMEFESDSFSIIDDFNNDFSSIDDSEEANNSLSDDKYLGVFARVPVEYARSGILVRLSKRNGCLYGYESGMTFNKIKVPLHRVISLEKE